MGILQLGHEFQHIGQLVAAFAAADVDDDLGIAPAGHLLLEHGLAGTKGAGNRRLAALEQGIEGVEDALPGNQRLDRVVALPEGARRAHRPAVEQLQPLDAPVRQLDPPDHFLDGVVALRGEFEQFAVGLRRDQDAVLDGCRFLHRAQHVAAGNMPAVLPPRIGYEAPAPVAGQGRNRDAARDAVAALVPDRIERALHAVEYGIEQAGAEFDRQRPTQSLGDLARTQAAGVFVELRQRAVALAADDFADQSDRADPDLFADHGFRQFQPDQRTIYLKYLAHLLSI